MSKSISPFFLAGALLLGIVPLGKAAPVQNVTREQLQRFIPNENDLQGFVRLRLAQALPSQDTTGADSDFVEINQDASKWSPGRQPAPGREGTINRILRNFASKDAHYTISVEVRLCDSPKAAADEAMDFQSSAQARYYPGKQFGLSQLGDESWFTNGALLFRYGNLMGFVSGDQSFPGVVSSKVPRLPASALVAVAYQICLRASQQARLTGVSTQAARLAVNGKPVSGSPLQVGKQVYVPVVEFARAMGLQSQWNDKTGALTLSGPNQQTISVTAASTSAKVGQTSVTLKTPVLKEANQPVMALDDLLTLVKGKVISRKGGAIEVKA